jgi:rhodanese-related sulfurtransferase
MKGDAMPTNVKEMLEAADAVVPRITPDQARTMMADGAVVIDVRDGSELEKTGRVKGALHIPRGMLEFRADAATSYHDKNLSKDKPAIVYCAAGARAALAGKLLKDMGYAEVYNLGGFKDWADGGGEVEH